jgi:hypothetical protein
LQEITKRLSSAEQVHTRILAVSTILDPSFKKAYFKNPVNGGKTALHSDLVLLVLKFQSFKKWRLSPIICMTSA